MSHLCSPLNSCGHLHYSILRKKKCCNYCALFPTVKNAFEHKKATIKSFLFCILCTGAQLESSEVISKSVVEACLSVSSTIQVSLLFFFFFTKLTFLFWYSICRYLLDRKESPNPMLKLHVFGV